MAWAEEKTEKTRTPRKSLMDSIAHELFDEPAELPDFIPNCTMIYGEDNTAKTGLALEVLSEEDIKEGKKAIIIDLDLGATPLLNKYHREKVQSGNIIPYNPIKWGEGPKGTPIIDYEATLDTIYAIAVAVLNNWEKQKVKAIIFDGGSKFLKFSEQQMRVEKALTPDGGVSQRYWIVRNKLFLEGLEFFKMLPIHTIFIFHNDFIPNQPGSEKIAAVKLQTNQMMSQKIFCERIDTGATVNFRATVHKFKGNIIKEGKVIEFATVNKEEEKFTWEGQKVLDELGFYDKLD